MPSTSRRGTSAKPPFIGKQRPADVTVISPAKWATQLGDEVLLCRDLGHTWMPHTASFDQRTRTFRQTLRCPRCTTLRVRLLSRNGDVLGSHYVYPDHYLAPTGVGRLDADVRSTLRLTSIKRLLDGAASAAQRVANVVSINGKNA